MKTAWVNLKNQNKHSFIDKDIHEDGVTVTVKLIFDKEWIAVVECSESFSENVQSAYQERSAVTIEFIHPSEDYVNYISTDLWTQMMCTQSDGQNSGR